LLESLLMAQIIDTNVDCTSAATALRAAGVRVVIRYYTRDSPPNSKKRLHKLEAQALVNVGLRLCVVHQGRGKHIADYFTRENGLRDGIYARSYAQVTMGQPSGSAIYFAVDYDAVKSHMQAGVVPYFQGVADGLIGPDGETVYRVGVYGNGLVCATLLDAGLASLTWLAQSTKWTDYDKFLKSMRWTLHQQAQGHVAGLSCDPNLLNATAPDVGDFTLQELPMSLIQDASTKYVNARAGLRVRAGPGTDFEKVLLLPYGTKVWCLAFSGSWTQVDLQGDGAADGYVSSGFLSDRPIAVATPQAGVVETQADAEHIPLLIALSNDADALAKAAETGKDAYPPYPTNGCALHLSALLRQAGIDVPLTYGAGAIAMLLERKRGWKPIDVGLQQAGDVGVTFDNDPKIPGADHVYVVVERVDNDKMLIADNQNDGKNAPHTRYASGRGKTPTDYFLRAE
jgi:hypothetical protein